MNVPLVLFFFMDDMEVLIHLSRVKGRPPKPSLDTVASSLFYEIQIFPDFFREPMPD